MDPIPFEKVTVEEAKAALKADKPAPSAPSVPGSGEWQRRSPSLDQQALADSTFGWLAEFEKGARPEVLARKYPRIANKLAELWKRPTQCERYLDDLLLDNRGGRKGFPPDVAAEITALKMYFITHVAPPQFSVWGDRIGTGR